MFITGSIVYRHRSIFNGHELPMNNRKNKINGHEKLMGYELCRFSWAVAISIMKSNKKF